MHSDAFTYKKRCQDVWSGRNSYPLESDKGTPATSQTESSTAH